MAFERFHAHIRALALTEVKPQFSRRNGQTKLQKEKGRPTNVRPSDEFEAAADII